MTVVLLVILAAIVVAVVAGFVMYNVLIAQKNRVESAWAQIDVQLTQRYDLIPNLVETVKGYAAHERETLNAVVEARNHGMSAGTPQEQAQAENEITGALRQLFALSEGYPELKANAQFLNLQEQLTAVEGKIAYARQFYNDNVLRYNTSIQKFPQQIFARMLGFREREYFEAEGDARGPVQVKF
jgi:LemA protein